MKRISSIDFLRGLVMVIMALDHTRDLFHIDVMNQDPTNLKTTTTILFFTRWLTHLCAPTFVFLSGVSAYLTFIKDGNTSTTKSFLLSRGLWLVFLEITVISFGIWFDIKFGIMMLQVIAAIGVSFIILSLLLKLSSKTIGIIGLCIILGHNLLSNVAFPPESIIHYIWGYLFKLSFWQLTPKFIILINYPIIPWLGIMLAGFGFGPYILSELSIRRKLFLKTGLVLLGIFILLRVFNIYGDPSPWSGELKAFLSFMNVSKYPPSLLFVCATLGISMLLLYFFDGKDNRFTKIISTYGKVPLFYYIIHWYVLHSPLLVVLFIQGFQWSDLNFGPFGFGRPKEGGGVSLAGVYLVWICVVTALYPICLWYSRYKSNHPEKKWLRYL